MLYAKIRNQAMSLIALACRAAYCAGKWRHTMRHILSHVATANLAEAKQSPRACMHEA
jgi:hypothetical protein